jgi:hypothetical protein
MFSVGAGIILFVCSAVTGNQTCALISLSIMLFLYACSVGGHGGIFATRRFGNRTLIYCGLGVLAILALLILTPIGESFSYGVPHIAKLMISLTLSIGYCVITQILRYFFTKAEQNPKKENEKYNYNERSETEDEDNC